MKEKERRELIERYNERLLKYGYDPKTLGWFKGRQRIRFDVLTEIGDLNNSSILDVGCGFGDLYGYLVSKGVEIDYTGIDINPKLVNIANELYSEAKFQIGDFEDVIFSERVDWVMASGIFNFKLSDNESFIENMMRKMYQICAKGIAVDFLSTYVDFMSEESYHSDPVEVFKLSKKLSKRVVIRHDYMPYEFCVYVYKKDEINENSVFSSYLT